MDAAPEPPWKGLRRLVVQLATLKYYIANTIKFVPSQSCASGLRANEISLGLVILNQRNFVQLSSLW